MSISRISTRTRRGLSLSPLPPCAAAAAALLPTALSGCFGALPINGRSQESVAAQSAPLQRLFTSTASIRGLVPDGRGGVWAASGGGVLHWNSSLARPQRWTAGDGLPSNDVLSVEAPPAGSGAASNSVVVQTSAGDCVLSLENRQVAAVLAPGSDPPSPSVRLASDSGSALPDEAHAAGIGRFTARAELPGGSRLAASAAGLWRQEPGGAWREVPLPSGSAASHVSALLEDADRKRTIAALYGDGLYALRAGQWERLDCSAACRDVTALAWAGARLVVGTNQEGALARMSGGRWERLADDLPGVLSGGDIESVAVWRGSTWLATFDKGIVRLPANAGATASAADQSSGIAIKNPRSLAAAGGRFYCRDADSQLYEFVGDGWQRPAWLASLPRRDIYCCGASPDGGRLYLGGWGGWASVDEDGSRDGSRAQSRFSDAPLAGQVVTCIAAAEDGAVWIGTQGKGLLRYDPRSGDYMEFHEAQGMTDDWVTSLCVRDGRVLVGTYTGGLLELRGDRLVRTLDARGYAIRSIAAAVGGDEYAATPLGVYVRHAYGDEWRLLPPGEYGGAESQCLCLTTTGLWVGGRTSLGWIDTRRAENF